MKKFFVIAVILFVGISILGVGMTTQSAPAVTMTVPYSAVPVASADLDGDPATGAWSDALVTLVPLENGAADPYGTATVYVKHDGTDWFLRVDGQVDVPWESAAGRHFWFGFLLSPGAVAGHHKVGQDCIFFGETSYASVSYPLSPVDTNGGGKPPSEDVSQDAVGLLRYSGSSAPYSFTAEWKRPLDTGDAQDLSLVPDGTTSYTFSITTDSDGRGSSGGTLDHAAVTNDNILRFQRPSTGDTTPPSVTFLAPGNGSAVQGVVVVRVDATDNVAVDHVDLLVNGTLLGTKDVAPYEFTWDTVPLRNGPCRLTATAVDTSFNSATSWIDVDVANPDVIAPVADAGPNLSVPPGVTVTLDGTASTDNQGIVNWSWSFVDLAPVVLYGPVVTYSFERVGSYLVTLTVADAAGNVDTDTASVNVTGDSEPPVAVAGPDQSVLPGTTVTLDGSQSTDDVGIENYTWHWTDGGDVFLYGVRVATVFGQTGDFPVTLTVRDFVGNSASDSLWINVSLPVDWASVPTLAFVTTEGSFPQEVRVQVATVGDQIFFHSNFTFAGPAANPALVYFAIEFDRSGKAFPMSAGDEMILVSAEMPVGSPGSNLSFVVTADQARPEPILPSPAVLVTHTIQGTFHDLVFARPLEASDPAAQVSLLPETAVRVAFAVGVWGAGAAHAYTLMSWELRVTAAGASLEALEIGNPGDIYRFAGVLGQIVLFATLAIVVFHAFRRRIWQGRHPVEEYCGANGKVPVERHSMGVRVLHWAHVGLMFVFIATGWSIFVKEPIFGTVTVPVHIVVSFLIVTIDYPLHFYFMWRSKELHFLFLPWKDDIVVSLSLIGNFFGVTKKYEEHATVDPTTGEWYKGRKYCSFQKGLLLMDLAAMAVMGISGYALYWPTQFSWLYDVLQPFGGYFLLRGFHLLMFYYFVSTLIAHAYLSFIPMNWGKLRSIVLSKGEVHTHTPDATEAAVIATTLVGIEKRP